MRLVPPFAVALALMLAVPGCIEAIEDRLRAGDVEAPRWQVGDWWVYRVTSDLYGTDAEVNVTVAEVNGSIYLLGYPEGPAPLEALLFHMPALGPVRDDLSWDVHGERFRPVMWPLEDQKTWQTKWITSDIHLTAHLRGDTWLITNEGFEDQAGGLTYNLTYDPDARWFSSFNRTDAEGQVRQGIELVSYGRGATGPVVAPTLIEVAFLEARSRLALSGSNPAPPNPTFTRAEGNETLLVGCIIGGAPGRYQADVTSPSGATACSRADELPAQDENYRLHVAEVPNEAGQWQVRLVAVGAGMAIAEVLAYPVKTFTSPGASS